MTTPSSNVSSRTFNVAGTAFSQIEGKSYLTEAGRPLLIYDGAALVGQAQVTADGIWDVRVTLARDGKHTLVARETDAAGSLALEVAASRVARGTPLSQIAGELLASPEG